MAEQNKIAQLLDKLNERIATQNKIIEDLKKLKCAIIETVYNGKGYEYRIGDIAENGGYPPTQNGDIRSLFWLFSLMALQN